MVKQIIPAEHHSTRKFLKKDGENYLNVSEFFYDTIQGEGINMGVPAAFLRLQNCHVNCVFCDTNEVWRYGTPWSYTELLAAIPPDLIVKLKGEDYHLVITGGSPLLQQDKLIGFLKAFIDFWKFRPFVEIENECTIFPKAELIYMVSCWNNSPKLTNSEVKASVRYKENVIQTMGQIPNSWFKFVIGNENEWAEINEFYVKPRLIRMNQILLMPKGGTREELELSRPIAIDMAVKYGVRFTDRLHVVAWNKKTGV